VKFVIGPFQLLFFLLRIKYDDTRNQIQRLATEQRWDLLRTLLTNRVKFGTAGIRGRMEAGNSRLNDLIVIQTCQGLTRYLLDTMNAELGIRTASDVQSKGEQHSFFDSESTDDLYSVFNWCESSRYNLNLIVI
jgi:hypothetical protein